jgi:hypothetical protein
MLALVKKRTKLLVCLLLTVIGGEATMGPLGGDCVQGCVRSPHPGASVMRLRGGRSLGGAGQGASHGADAASAQGVQLPLLRNVLDFATSLTASSNASSPSQIDRWLTHPS